MRAATAWIAALVGVLPATSLAAQTTAADCATPPVVAVVPHAGYRAGGIHRFFLGAHYRDLWTDTLRVPVLHLACVAGGVRIVRLGGGQQTKSLRLQDGAGRLYAFRSLDKDPAKALPEELRGTIANRILQDQVSGALPAGPLVAARLADAVQVPHLSPQLFQMADDPELGEYRATFAGMIGFLEIGVAEADVDGDENKAPISTAKLFARLTHHADEAVDVPAFVAARLFDVYIGDWDRHQDQWRWVARTTPGGRRWAPVPRDRDQAFVRLDGFLLAVARRTQPKFVKFGPEYSSITGVTWNGRDLDRRLLSAADWRLWDSTAKALQAGLTDAVIDEAVARMVPVNARESERLAAGLRARRDKLPAAARHYYEYLASDVDIHGTDERDVATLAWRENGDLDVTVTVDDDTTFARRFVAGETREIRLYLDKGKDTVVLTGEGPARIVARLIGGSGGERVVDSLAPNAGGRRLVVYDREPADSIPPSSRVATSGRRFVPPAKWDSTKPPPRDWGAWSVPSTQVYSQPDVGVFVGGGRTRYWYGFRQFPYRASLTVKAGFAFGAMLPRVEVLAELPEWSQGLRPTIRALASGIEQLRFHGIGNETELTEPKSFYRTRMTEYRLDLALERRLSRRTRLAIGPTVSFNHSDTDDPDRILSVERPYGSGDFGMAGARATLELDTRDLRGAPTRGATFKAGASVFPAVWDVAETFGEVHGDFATYFRVAPGAPTLALHAGGKKVWGDYPFLQAAYVGGATTLRGFNEQRFAGAAAAWGGAELRQPLGGLTLVLPARVGVFALGDVGRVFVRGESSDTWHTGVGGGLSLGYLNGASTITLAVARSTERTAFYVRGGYAF